MLRELRDLLRRSGQVADAEPGLTVFENEEAWMTLPAVSIESIVSSGSPSKGSSR